MEVVGGFISHNGGLFSDCSQITSLDEACKLEIVHPGLSVIGKVGVV